MSQLQTILVDHIQSGWQANPALTTLINDYAKYHLVLVFLGGIVLLVSLFLTVCFWIRFRRAFKVAKFRWRFEKKVFFAFALTLSLFSLFFALVWIANLTTALRPLPGFSSLASTTVVQSESAIGKALVNWVETKSTSIPPILKTKVQERINWQRPKAIVCGILLVLFVYVSIRIWNYLIIKSRIDDKTWTLKDRSLIACGGMTFALCLLFAIMMVANAQGAIGPITISLLGAGN